MGLSCHVRERTGQRRSLRRAVLALMVAVMLPGAVLCPQGISTGTIRGVVRAQDGRSVEGAQVRVLNIATGVTVRLEVRHGQFLANGLEVGGRYVVSVRSPGLVPQQSEPRALQLGEPLELQFVMKSAAVVLDAIQIIAAVRPGFPSSGAGGGVATTIPDSLLHALPTLNRNFQDFSQLAPQISTKVGLPTGGLSGGGALFRFNRFLIDGAPEAFPTGNSSLAFGGGKSVPIAAVHEYQVLLAPYDVRYGDFTGALVNTVTRSGTNELHGSVFAYGRTDDLARSGAALPYERLQYGWSLGGPIVRDRLQFFVASELQYLTSQAEGPYVGQPATARPLVPVSETYLARFIQIMGRYSLQPGSTGAVQNYRPLTNVFARLDLALPDWNSRAMASVSYARGTTPTFSRAALDTFSLSTYQWNQPAGLRLIQAQLQTTLSNSGGYNELLLMHRASFGNSLSAVRQPIVRVTVPAASGGGTVTLQSGTNEAAQGIFSSSWTIRLADHLTLPLGAAHLVSAGIDAELLRLNRDGVAGAYGTWTFANLDSFAVGTAQRFSVAQDFGTASIPLDGGQYAVYLGDRWQADPRLAVTIGVRADKYDVRGHPPYNHDVDSIFGRRTDVMPRWSLVLSPRLGLDWELSPRDRLRGGIGVFAGPPPRSWPHVTLYRYGVGGVLSCGPGDPGPTPPFVPDVGAVPQTCANGAGLSSPPRGDVDLLDPNLRMARTLRWSLGYERQLPFGLVATGEVLVTRNLSDFAFTNLNLVDTGLVVDRFGRVLYGSIAASGVATANTRSSFSEVIDVVNTSRDHSVLVTARLEKRYAGGFAVAASYTYSQVRDAQTPLLAGTRGTLNWSSRAVSGRQDDLTPGVSLNQLPHRVVLAVTYAAPWRRWSTVLSVYYIGESGSPFTFTAYGTGGRGDLNADGAKNDPIYVPRSVADSNEIRFAGASAEVASQQAAFDHFISTTPCLDRQRGRIMARNSCQGPWTNTSIISMRQAIPLAGGLEAELDVFNLLNLLDADWGLYQVADPAMLEQVGQTTGAPGTTQPIFRFNVARPRWTTLTTESAFQLQVALTYRF
jgi:carboxypeptidase family protein/TonB-dependent receptor-like protein